MSAISNPAAANFIASYFQRDSTRVGRRKEDGATEGLLSAAGAIPVAGLGLGALGGLMLRNQAQERARGLYRPERPELTRLAATNLAQGTVQAAAVIAALFGYDPMTLLVGTVATNFAIGVPSMLKGACKYFTP